MYGFVAQSGGRVQFGLFLPHPIPASRLARSLIDPVVAPLGVLLASRRLPVHLMSQPLAETIVRMLPTEREAPFDITFGMPTFGHEDWPPGLARQFYSNHLPLDRDLQIAKKAYGRFSSAQARDLLLAGVEDWHSRVVLVSRIDNLGDSLVLLRSKLFTATDHHGDVDLGRGLWERVERELGMPEANRLAREIAGY